MRVYCAGKTQDRRRVQIIQKLVRATGHEVTHDWTQIVDKHGGDVNEVEIPQETKEQYAQWDLAGVYYADMTIALGHPKLCGTLYECGATLVLNKPLWLVEWENCTNHSLFEYHPLVLKLDIQELGQKLWDVSAHRLELEIPSMAVKATELRWDEGNLE